MICIISEFRFPAARVNEPGLLTTFPALEVEHLYIHLGRAYELNAEWEKARTAYLSMLVYAREEGELAMESAAFYWPAILVAQQSFDQATGGRILEGIGPEERFPMADKVLDTLEKKTLQDLPA